MFSFCPSPGVCLEDMGYPLVLQGSGWLGAQWMNVAWSTQSVTKGSTFCQMPPTKQTHNIIWVQGWQSITLFKNKRLLWPSSYLFSSLRSTNSLSSIFHQIPYAWGWYSSSHTEDCCLIYRENRTPQSHSICKGKLSQKGIPGFLGEGGAVG